MDVPLHPLPAAELASRIRTGTLSPVDVVEAHVDRIRALDDSLSAFVTVTEAHARAVAADAEAAVARGDDLGPLHGVPLALKDLTGFKAGVRHTFGCRLFDEYVPDFSAAFVERLEAAGAIVVGKTNTPEFGHRPTTDNLLVGPTRNPFDPSKNAGGSSGGSAAAVAAGMTALGQGGDAGGSIRIPAALCGVYGLKPSFGRVPQTPRPNAFLHATPFIDKGPLTRTVADAALMLDVMAGPHPRDPFSLPDDGSDFVGACNRPVDDLTVAYSPDLGAFRVSSAVRTAVEDAVDSLERAGATVDRVDVDFGWSLDELREGVRKPLAGRLAASVAGNVEREYDLDFFGADADAIPESFANRIRIGRALTRTDLERAKRLRTDVFDAVEDVFEAHDLLATPTLAVASVPNGIVGPSAVDGKPIDPESDWLLTWPFNLTGHPAASVPAGFTSSGHPVGLQLVGRRFDESTVLAASAAIERERPWADTYQRISFE